MRYASRAAMALLNWVIGQWKPLALLVLFALALMSFGHPVPRRLGAHSEGFAQAVTPDIAPLPNARAAPAPATPSPMAPAPSRSPSTPPPMPAATTPPPAAVAAPPTPVAPATGAPAASTPAAPGGYGYGCAAALAYLAGHAAPGFVSSCPHYAGGHQATTICTGAPACQPGTEFIWIADPCPAAYMNEASNSWVLIGQSDSPWDPYGYCGERGNRFG